MALVGIMPFFTFALGTWQVQRLKWKVNLIDELEEKLRREPLMLPPKIKYVHSRPGNVPQSPNERTPFVSLAIIPEFVYRKVLMSGKWDYGHTIIVGPRTRDGTAGYHVVTPLVRSNGTTVLVDRGFVSKDAIEKFSKAADADEEVFVQGMLRVSQVRNNFTPDNHPEKGEWYWIDVDAMAEYAGGEKANVQPVFVEEIFGVYLSGVRLLAAYVCVEGHAGEAAARLREGIPVGKSPVVEMRNSHMSYVVTWQVHALSFFHLTHSRPSRYSLSAFTTFMFLRLLTRQRRAHARMPR